jgi:hypothetical protein
MDKQSRDWPAAERERRRALTMLTRSPEGCTEAILLAYGFKIEMLARLVLDGYATTAMATAAAGGRELRVVRMMITDAGRAAIAE